MTDIFNHGYKGDGHDTVGAVAFDMHGYAYRTAVARGFVLVGPPRVHARGVRHVACATSTGGITAKIPGRVGDSPLVGRAAWVPRVADAHMCHRWALAATPTTT